MRLGRQLLIVMLLAMAAHAADAPGGVSIGQNLERARPILESACKRTDEKRYTGAMAAPAKEVQTQIDCYELDAYGGQRKVEYMFNDGVLAFAWVLVEAEELATLEAKLSSVHGEVIYEKGGYRVFASGEIALRNTPPEILIASPEMMRDLTGYARKE